jgi:hypothetical protein
MTHEEREELRDIFEDKPKPVLGRLTEHHETLYGNGREGLKAQVGVLLSGYNLLKWMTGVIFIAVMGALATKLLGAW